MGQYIQQGERMLMETVVRFAPAEHQMIVPFDEANGDGLNFLAGKTMDFINRQAMDGTLLAHVEGGVPNIILNLDENNARTMGQLIYFFEYACGLSGYLLGVNPFDQPGVEAYKRTCSRCSASPDTRKWARSCVSACAEFLNKPETFHSALQICFIYAMLMPSERPSPAKEAGIY